MHHEVTLLYVVGLGHDVGNNRSMLGKESFVVNLFPFKSFVEWSLLVECLHVVSLRGR